MANSESSYGQALGNSKYKRLIIDRLRLIFIKRHFNVFKMGDEKSTRALVAAIRTEVTRRIFFREVVYGFQRNDRSKDYSWFLLF